MEGKPQPDAAGDSAKSKTLKWKVKNRVVSRGLSQPDPSTCTHPTLMKDMCAECGADLRETPGLSGMRKEAVAASVAMVHSVPELIVSEEEALRIGKADEERLLRTRKLVLLVDLDQTLIHTTNDNIPANLKGVYHFQLAHGNSVLWYHTRLRPNTGEFLRKVSKLYELHICTFGVRLYAHRIANFLDPEGKYFSHRILSRDECFSFNSKIPNLKALFPCGDSLVCIIDDREDVWSFSPNLVHVKPYRFFQGTADINAPPGCQKTEADSNPIKHQVRRISHTSDGNSQVVEVDKEGVKKEKEMDQKAEDDENKMTSVEESETVKNKKDNKETDDKGVEMEDGCICSTENLIVSSSNTEKEKTAEQAAGETVKEKSEQSEKTETDGETDGRTDGETELKTVSEEIEWVDEDDYLYYLEEILTRIHKAFYDVYDQMTQKGNREKVPDMKSVIPYVKKKVLKGVNVLFSGVFPTNMPAEKSQAYSVAKSLGANVHTNFVPKSPADDSSSNYTTHVIAARLGTSKVRAAQKSRSAFLVTPDWLWSCGERWERVDERLFALTEDTQSSIPLKRCSPDLSVQQQEQLVESVPGGKRKNDTPAEEVYVYDRVTGKRILPGVSGKRQRAVQDDPREDNMKLRSDASKGGSEGEEGQEKVNPGRCEQSESFAKSYNPLYSLSDEEIANMDREVEELMEDDDVSDNDDGGDVIKQEEEDSEDIRKEQELRRIVLGKSLPHESSSEEDSMTGDFPRGWRIKKKLTKMGKMKSQVNIMDKEDGEEDAGDVDAEQNSEESEEEEGRKTSQQDYDSDKSDDSIGSVDDLIAEAVEKEFLS